MTFRTLVCLAGLWLSQPAVAQSSGAAHLYAYALTDRPAFERGYRQHLEWHARKGDQLVWYGWYVVAGERVGAFVDGTFGTTVEALSNRIEPENDAADFKANASSHAKALGNEAWNLWPEASTANTLEHRRPTQSIEVYLIEVKDPKHFEAAVVERPSRGVAWYRAPGRPNAYLVIGSEVGEADCPNLERLLGNHPAVRDSRAVRSEIWRYEPSLSRIPQ